MECRDEQRGRPYPSSCLTANCERVASARYPSAAAVTHGRPRPHGNAKGQAGVPPCTWHAAARADLAQSISTPPSRPSPRGSRDSAERIKPAMPRHILSRNQPGQGTQSCSTLSKSQRKYVLINTDNFVA